MLKLCMSYLEIVKMSWTSQLSFKCERKTSPPTLCFTHPLILKMRGIKLWSLATLPCKRLLWHLWVVSFQAWHFHMAVWHKVRELPFGEEALETRWKFFSQSLELQGYGIFWGFGIVKKDRIHPTLLGWLWSPNTFLHTDATRNLNGEKWFSRNERKPLNTKK